MRFKLLHRLDGIVNQRKARGLAAAVLRPHAEHVDLVFVGFVNLGQSRAQVVFRDIRAVRVEDIAV